MLSGRTLRAAASAAAILLLAGAPARAQLKTEVVTVDVRPGVTMRYLEVLPNDRPSAAVILFPGGGGKLDLDRAGKISTGLALNFLVRSREPFAGEGLLAAAVDVASDQRGGLNGDLRLSQQHAQDIAKIIASVRSRAGGAPVWLVGTSSSTISVAGAAARLAGRPSGPDGIVLSSVQTTLVEGLCGRTVHFADLSAISVPVLVLSHRDDGCPCSPGSDSVGRRLMAALTKAPAKERLTFTGGDPPLSRPCEARSPHGFLGIEADVVKTIARWIREHPPQ